MSGPNPFEPPEASEAESTSGARRPGALQRRLGVMLLFLGIALGTFTWLAPAWPARAIGLGPALFGTEEIFVATLVAMGAAVVMVLLGLLLAAGRRW